MSRTATVSKEVIVMVLSILFLLLLPSQQRGDFPQAGMTEVRKWHRPASVRIPTVWARYSSRKPMPNGIAPIFRIQDYSEEWRDAVYDNMLNFFLRDEPLSKSLNVREDPEAVKEFKGIFQEFLDRKMALVAIVDNLQELGDDSLPRLAGYNITAVVTSDEKAMKTKSRKIQKILDALHELEEKKNCFEHYGVSEFMYALGLSVHSAYRGHGLAVEILKARFPLCRAVGVKVTVTVFTAKAAQRSAEKAGFELLAVLPYGEYKDERGDVVFKIEGAEGMKLMGVRVP